MAIDTPLGFSKGFLALISSLTPAKMEEKCNHQHNPYLFRETESFLSEYGFTPLSAVNDMIGSQATKGMHVLVQFAPSNVETGVWQDANKRLTIIETYPTVNKGTQDTKLPESSGLHDEHVDIQDAYVCARMAYLFDKFQQKLKAPPEIIYKNEGWIWVFWRSIKPKKQRIEN